MKQFSLIIPIYNVEEYLDKCLKSIRNQTFLDIEVILINDGSTDNSLSVAQKYVTQDERFILVSQSNAGLSAARNTGLKMATGEYIAFVDSDDWIEPMMFDKLASLLLCSKPDFICFRLQFDNLIRKTSVVYGNDYAISSIVGAEEIVKDALLVCNIPTAAWAKVYKRTFLEHYNITFKEGIVNEDTLFTLQVACHAMKVEFVNQVFYHAVEREGSISRSSYERLFMDMHTALVCAREEMMAESMFSAVEFVWQCRYIKSMLYNLLQAAQRLPLKNYVDVLNVCFQRTLYLQYYSSASKLPLKHRLMYRLSLHRYCFFYLLRVAYLLGFRMH